MKKLLLYALAGSLFISLIMTLTQNKTIIFTFNSMIQLFSDMPKVNMSVLYDTLINMDLSFWQFIPIVGTIIEISQSILIGVIFVCDSIIQVATFVIYLVPRLFTGTV